MYTVNTFMVSVYDLFCWHWLIINKQQTSLCHLFECGIKVSVHCLTPKIWSKVHSLVIWTCKR